MQDLLDAKELSFAPIGPNVQNNPMPPHHGAAANAIGFDDGHDLVTQVGEVQMSMEVLREHLLQQEVLQELHNFCLKCSSNPDECEDLKNSIQRLMDEGVVRVEKVIPEGDVAILEILYYPTNVHRNTSRVPLVIQVPALPALDQNLIAPLPI